jgi:DNA-binding transcriptional LysR family regulator
VFEELELARQATRAVSGVVYGTVSIGFPGALNHRTLPPLTPAVRRRYPEVALKLVGRVMTRDGVAQIEQGALDLAFVSLPLDPSPLVRTRLVGREPLGVALPVDHPLATDSEIDLADLAGDGFITMPAALGSGLQEAGLRACVDAGFRPQVVQEITDPFMILTLVAAGVGVALMARRGRGDHAIGRRLPTVARGADLPPQRHRLVGRQPVGGAEGGARRRRRGVADAID